MRGWKSEPTRGYRRPATARDSTRRKVDTPEMAARIVRETMREDQECFTVLSIDIRNGLISSDVVAIGTVCGVEVHPREVFRAAIKHAAAGIVLAHNHPSGDPTPSVEDIALTHRLREAGEILGIPVVDHVVVTRTRSVSMAGEGLL